MEDRAENQTVVETERASGSGVADITEFRQEYRFLSNFWPCRVFLAPHWYPTVEHAYQAAKCLHPADALDIRNADSAGMAKRMGSDLRTMRRVRPDWHTVSIEIMSDLLWQKFILNHTLRDRLIATGDRKLVEGNSHHDTFWGVYRGTGTNHLGNLLMRLRTVARYIAENQPAARDGIYSDGRQPAESAG